MPKKGKARENNECRKAQFIFADVSFISKYFPKLSANSITSSLISNERDFCKWYRSSPDTE